MIPLRAARFAGQDAPFVAPALPAPRTRVVLRRLGLLALGLLVYFAGWMLVGAAFASTYWYFTGRLPSWLPLP